MGSALQIVVPLTIVLFCQTFGTFAVSVDLSKGRVSGIGPIHGNGVTKFLGVPYAAPPTASRRFARPVDVPSWTGDYNATFHRPVCPQDFQELELVAGVVRANFNISYDLPKSFSEDCLYVDIYIPGELNKTSALPVLVNFQDSWFQTISPQSRGGSRLALHGKVIVINVNHRLGALGFYGSGNFGLLDQNHALVWIQENIVHFGGDPKKVTIFGSESGAFSVGLHVLSPLSQGLFSRAISQGGNALMTKFLDTKPNHMSNEFSSALNCSESDLACLRNVAVDKILEVQKNLFVQHKYFFPAVDGSFLPAHPDVLLHSGNFSKVDYILGFNNDAGTLWHPETFLQIQSGINEGNYTDKLTRWAYEKFQPNAEAPLAFLLFEYRTTLDNSPLSPGQTWLKSLLTAGRDATAASMRMVQRMHRRHGGKVFAYYFNQRPTGASYSADLLSAPSGVETLYLFGHENVSLSKQMAEAWGSFANSGSPQFTAEGKVITWPEFEASTGSFLDIHSGMTAADIRQQYPGRLDRRMDLWSDVLVEMGNTTVACKPSPPEVSTPPRVNLTQGILEGQSATIPESGFTYELYRGIPYAAPPLGDLRWKPPKMHNGWTGVRQNGPPVMCPQVLLMFAFPGEQETEDCLQLDVFVPYGVKHLSQQKLPVMIFIHGGGFTVGSKNLAPGINLVQYDVLYVSINYRLGVLGFLSTGDSIAPGNYGLLDQQHAIKWVKENIAKFGGDPDEITIFGESAGGMSVSAQMLSPSSKGLFKRAIAQSGSMLSPGAMTKQPRRVFDLFTSIKNCTKENTSDSLTCLRSMDAISISSFEGYSPQITFQLKVFPVVDGQFFPASPLELYRGNTTTDIALMTGYNYADGYAMGLYESYVAIPSTQLTNPAARAAFEFRYADVLEATNKTDINYQLKAINMMTDTWFGAPSVRESQLHSQQGGKTYSYFFEHPNPSKPDFVRGDHGDELNYLFAWGYANFTRADRRMSSIISRLWTNFASTGDPNMGIPLPNFDWPAYTTEQPIWLHLTSDLGRPGVKSHLTPETDGKLLRSDDLAFINKLLPEIRASKPRPCFTTSPPVDAVPPKVTLAQGELLGHRMKSNDNGFPYELYNEIPYAEPPVGDLRWRAPKLHPGWKGVRPVQNVVSACPNQYPVFGNVTEKEDCLYLDVYVPYGVQKLGSRRLPVMVFIHGGGFMNRHKNMFDGSVLITQDIIYVAMNYRLGPLGFISTGDSTLPGNYGVLDQRLALHWVKANIGKFGGNPEKITIFGVSAGGISVTSHMVSPLSKGLFNRVISQSGSILAQYAVSDKSDAQRTFRAVLRHNNCTGTNESKNLECLRAKDPIALCKNLPAFVSFNPVVDGVFLPKSPLELIEDNVTTSVDLMIGHSQADGYTFSLFGGDIYELANAKTPWERAAIEFQYNEALETKNAELITNMLTDFMFASPAERTAKINLRKGGKTYYYLFEHRPPTTKSTVPAFVRGGHADETPYVFGLPSMRHMYRDDDKELSRKMVALWTNFAHTGNPTKGIGLSNVEWPQYSAEDPQVLILSTQMGQAGYNSVITPQRAPKLLRPESTRFWYELYPSLQTLELPQCVKPPVPPSGKPMVNLTQGLFEGKMNTIAEYGFNYETYIGIPYAAPPLGDLRWKPPQVHSGWSGVRQSGPSVACPQSSQTYILDFEQETEDCLQLDVYVPYGVKHLRHGKLPVMVFIHGGAYTAGSKTLYSGVNLIQYDVVYVAINYRLGVLGFLSSGDSVAPGNYGLMDQQLAIKWVKENIAKFGGDPDEITIFGQSAGAGSVSAQVLSPSSKGLFKRAIAQSGSIFSPWSWVDQPRTVFDRFAGLKNCSKDMTRATLECLRNIDAIALNSLEAIPADLQRQQLLMTPVADGRFFPASRSQLLRDSASTDITFMTGHNFADGYVLGIGPQYFMGASLLLSNPAARTAFEFQYADLLEMQNRTTLHYQKEVTNAMTDFMFSAPIDKESLLRVKYGGKTYRYFYEHPSKGKPDFVRGDHGGELDFLFGWSPANYTRDDLRITHIISRLWTNFATTGDPNKGVPLHNFEWPPYTAKEPILLHLTSDLGQPGVKSNLSLEVDGKLLRSDDINFMNELLPNLEASKPRPCSTIAPPVDTDPPKVTLAQGELLGHRLKSEYDMFPYELYNEIPYAEPPVGDLRWRAPKPHPGWKGVRPVQNVASACPNQYPVFGNVTEKEDCLYLDVYVPYGVQKLGSRRLPVMVFIHGGGFMNRHKNMFDGSVLITQDIIYAVMNYRLGPLGFLSTGDSTLPGNYGVLDQQLALGWVKVNIEKFGGNPEKITIFGVSAGGISVTSHMVSPLSKGLFNRVISQSGSILAQYAVSDKSDAQRTFRAVLRHNNCTSTNESKNLECLRAKDPIALCKNLPAFANFNPVVDGVFLPKSPLELIEDNVTTSVDLMIGHSQADGYTFSLFGGDIYELANAKTPWERAAIKFQYNEALETKNAELITNMLTDFMFASPAERTAKINLRKGGKNYYYLFEHRPPTTKSTVPAFVRGGHADETPYVFGLPSMRHMYRDDDKELSRKLVALWTNFAHTGNPTKGMELSNVEWPQYSAEHPQVLLLSTQLGQDGYDSVITPQGAPKLLRPESTRFWYELYPSLQTLELPQCVKPPVPPSGKPMVNLTQGMFEGNRNTIAESGFNYETYIGIPYAAPPLGDLRWKPPQVHSGWSGVRQSGPFVTCPQSSRIYVLDFEQETEDCLELDVYVPYGVKHLRHRKLPVMVFIHGGGYTLGSKTLYSGVNLIQYDVVYVAINYRLGVLGFLSSGDSVAPGNYGLMDQQLAIKWVKENIAKFGGDPDEITIFGESAGAGSVSAQVLSPSSKGLFKRAIAQSGSIFSPWSWVDQPRTVFDHFVGLKNCSKDMTRATLECLRNIDAIALNSLEAIPTDLRSQLLMTPVADGRFFPASRSQLLRDSASMDITFMMGHNFADGYLIGVGSEYFLGASLLLSDPAASAAFEFQYADLLEMQNRTTLHYQKEVTNVMTDFMFSAPADKEALLRDKWGGKTYRYFYEHPSKGKPDFVRGDHADELDFLFGWSLANYTRDDLRITHIISRLWTNFATTGDPTKGVTLPGVSWPLFSKDDPSILHLTSDLGEPGVPSVITNKNSPDLLRPLEVEFMRDLLPRLANRTEPSCIPATTSPPPYTGEPTTLAEVATTATLSTPYTEEPTTLAKVGTTATSSPPYTEQPTTLAEVDTTTTSSPPYTERPTTLAEVDTTATSSPPYTERLTTLAEVDATTTSSPSFTDQPTTLAEVDTTATSSPPYTDLPTTLAEVDTTAVGKPTEPSTPIDKNILNLAPKVAVEFSLDADYDVIVGDNKVTVVATFKVQIADEMNIKVSRILNFDLRRGSIVVSFDLEPPTTPSETPSGDAVTTLQTSISNGTLAIKDGNGTVITALPNSLKVVADVPSTAGDKTTSPPAKPTNPGIGPFGLSYDDANILIIVLGSGLGTSVVILIGVCCCLAMTRRRMRRMKSHSEFHRHKGFEMSSL